MDISSRKDAINGQRSTYYTGKHCTNGHLTYRYTKSGACAGCVASSNAAVRGMIAGVPGAPYVEQRAQKQEIEKALSNLVEFKVRAYPADFDLIKETAISLTLARYPMLGGGYVVDRRGPVDGEGGTYLYRIRCHADDVTLIQQTALALLNAHRVDLSAHLAKIHQAVFQQLDAEATSPSEWRPGEALK